MRAQCDHGLMRGIAQRCICVPAPCKRNRTGNQHHQGQRDKQQPQTDARARCEKSHDPRSAPCRLKLLGLKIAHKQRSHKQRGGSHQKKLQGGEGTEYRLHGVTLYRKVKRRASQILRPESALQVTWLTRAVAKRVRCHIPTTNNSPCVIVGFTILLQLPRDTTPVIPHNRQLALFERHAGSVAILDPPVPNFVPEIPFTQPRIHAEVGRYRVRLAETREDREAGCRLRFKVFNMELGEGLESSYETGLDTDQFDSICEHLLVEDLHAANASRRIVGTYRMQSGATAARHLGYYSEQEFSFAPYELLRPGILELGRASIDREHRTPEVLTLLWRGIAQYATGTGLRYLVGCSSLNSRNPHEGWQLYRQLETFRVLPEFATEPTPEYLCPNEPHEACAQPLVSGVLSAPETPAHSEAVKVPRLLKTYLAIGARIAAPPAWDRGFGTIDFLTLLDLKLLSPAARHRFLAPLTE